MTTHTPIWKQAYHWTNNKLVASITWPLLLALVGVVVAFLTLISRIPTEAQAHVLRTHVQDDERQHLLDAQERATIKEHLAQQGAQLGEIKDKVDQVPQLRGKVDAVLAILQGRGTRPTCAVSTTHNDAPSTRRAAGR
jgi:hypothetical protein